MELCYCCLTLLPSFCLYFLFSSLLGVYCGRPPQIKNGKHTNSYRNIFEYNELVTYTCNPSNGPDEYSLVGESKLFCSAPGKWSSAPPQCKGNSISICFNILKIVLPVSKQNSHMWFLLLCENLLFFFFFATPVAYESSQAMCSIRASAAGLCCGHSNDKLCM